jgi:hypothetical protein
VAGRTVDGFNDLLVRLFIRIEADVALKTIQTGVLRLAICFGIDIEQDLDTVALHSKCFVVVTVKTLIRIELHARRIFADFRIGRPFRIPELEGRGLPQKEHAK